MKKDKRKRPTLARPKASPRPSEAQLRQDLQVHQVELELQNEELRNARQRTEEALARYTEVFEFAPIGYATLNAAGEIREVNHVGASLLGLDRAFLVGKRFDMCVAGNSLLTFREFLAGAAERTTRCDLMLRGPDTQLHARLTAATIRGGASILVAFEDISDSKRKEIELERTEHALREANRRKDDFLAMLSHELRNPLSPITLCVSILKRAPAGSEAASNALDIIERSSAHLTRLVGDLLDATKILHGKIGLRRRDIELTALLEDVIKDLRPVCESRGIRVDKRFAPGEHWVHGDDHRLSQVFTNLLANAEKFSGNDSRILITLDQSSSGIVVRVIDAGVGIERELLDTLFEPFVQAEQGLDRSHGGLGLGLAMVKVLVELHGGRVALTSDGLGKGAQATVQLPSIRAPERRRLPQVAAHAKRRRVLIIEDKRDTAESLAHALSLTGHDIKLAFDGASGIELAREMRPDVVFCDLGLPDIDGFAVARELRACEDLQHVYLVALTGYARPEDVTRATEAGFDRHLAKPAKLDELEALLAELP